MARIEQDTSVEGGTGQRREHDRGRGGLNDKGARAEGAEHGKKKDNWKVFRLSMRSTSQPGAADYAAVKLHKNVWQLSNEAGSRIAVFATPLALSRRPQSVKRWRTRLFLSGCENSGLDERTGVEVEAILTDDHIIEFSHI